MQAQELDKCKELVDCCQRNCLLVLLLSYMPMPETHRRKPRASCTFCGCIPRQREHNFAGSMQLLNNTTSLSVARSLITGASQAAGNLPVFSLKNLMQDDAARTASAVHGHEYSEEESQLAKETIEMLFTVSSPNMSDTKGDIDMVCSCKNLCHSCPCASAWVPAAAVADLSCSSCLALAAAWHDVAVALHLKLPLMGQLERVLAGRCMALCRWCTARRR